MWYLANKYQVSALKPPLKSHILHKYEPFHSIRVHMWARQAGLTDIEQEVFTKIGDYLEITMFQGDFPYLCQALPKQNNFKAYYSATLAAASRQDKNRKRLGPYHSSYVLDRLLEVQPDGARMKHLLKSFNINLANIKKR